MSSCRRRLAEAGLAAPRTCAKCGLFGECREPPTFEEIRAKLRVAAGTENVKTLAAHMMQGASVWRDRSAKVEGHRVYGSDCRKIADTLEMTALVMTAVVAERDALSSVQDGVAARMRSDVVLPTRDECVDAVLEERGSALQKFVFQYEPMHGTPQDREIFRAYLAAMIREVRS